MRSQGRRRRRSRRTDPAVWLWSLFLVNLALGLGLSPLTAVRRVRVVGAADDDHERIVAVLQELRDVPFVRLRMNGLRSQLAEDSEVEAVSVNPNLFGRAVARFTLRSPVAVVANSRVYMDERGRAFRSTRRFGDLPKLVPPPRALGTNGTILASWESGTVCGLCKSLAEQIPNVGWTVAVSERGVISLEEDSGATVELGSSDRLPHKIDKLKALLLERPDMLKKVRKLNLTYPDAPMVERG